MTTPYERELKAIARKYDILATVPEAAGEPIVTFNAPCPVRPSTPGAWLSFRATRDREPSEVLAALEQAGFVPVPCTLVRYGWRGGALRAFTASGVLGEAPRTYDQYNLKSEEAIAPLWIDASSLVGASAHVRYRGPDGSSMYRVSVDTGLRVGLYASTERLEDLEGWRYTPGSPRLTLPPAFHGLHHDGACIARPSPSCAAHLGGDPNNSKSINGHLYFEIFGDQESFPLTPSEMLRQLEADLL